MTRLRWTSLFLSALILLGLTHTAAAIPGLPSLPIPSIGGGKAPEAWFATGLPDAVTDAPFLDVYDPAHRIPAQEMPRGLRGEFLLGAGAYDLWAQSYCLTPGAHRPGAAGRGDGYVYAPPKGKGATAVESILHRAYLHPEIPQHDIQVLLWALIAQTPYDKLDPKLRQAADVLLDKKDLDALKQAAQARQTAEVLNRVAGYLPGPVQQVLHAESTLRGMLSGALPGYSQIEAIAVAAGEPGHQEGDREIVRGRWSYHPDGYFVSYFPSGYQQTLCEVVNPGSLQIGVDGAGRVNRIADQAGNSVEVQYEDRLYALPHDPAVRIAPFKKVRLCRVVPWKPQAPVTLEVTSGYALVGLAESKAPPAAGSGPLATLPNRYAWSATHRKQVEALTAAICKLNKRPVDAKARKNMIPILVNVGNLAEGLREAVGPNQRVLVNPVYEAWMAGVVTFGDKARHPGQAFLGGPARVALGGVAGDFDFDDTPRPAPKWLKQWDPSRDVSQPGNQGRQRLGLSSRNSDHDRDQPSGRRDGRHDGNDPESPDKDSWKNKDILVKARECMGYIEGVSDLGSALDDPLQFATGKGQAGIGLDFQGTVKDAMFDFIFESAGQISVALGGDPPRPDFDLVTMPMPVDLAAVGQGMKRPLAPDGLLATALELEAVLRAAQVARDRLGGAVNAGNAAGVERQAQVLVELKRRAGLLWVRLADRLDEAAARADKRAAAAAQPYLVRLKSAGFTKAELDAARRLGLSSAQLDALKSQRLAQSDARSRGRLGDDLRRVAASWRNLGQMWSCLPAMPIR